MFKFETLEVWKKSVEFANLMIEIADCIPRNYQYSFGDQLRRAGLSVPNCIVEGNGRRSTKESNQLYNVSKGSVYECINIIIILDMRKLIDWSIFDKRKVYKLAEEIAKMLTGLMRRK